MTGIQGFAPPISTPLSSDDNHLSRQSSSKVASRLKDINPNASNDGPKLEIMARRSLKEEVQKNLLGHIAVCVIIGGMAGAFAGPPGIAAGIGAGIIVGTTTCLSRAWLLRNERIDGTPNPRAPFLNIVDGYEAEHEGIDHPDMDFG